MKVADENCNLKQNEKDDDTDFLKTVLFFLSQTKKQKGNLSRHYGAENTGIQV